MAVSPPMRPRSHRDESHCEQCQDARDTERHVGADIDPADPSSIYFREPATLEMANSIRRHCALLDKYGMWN